MINSGNKRFRTPSGRKIAPPQNRNTKFEFRIIIFSYIQDAHFIQVTKLFFIGFEFSAKSELIITM